ncbi:hypothetical protein Godav_017676 [Gossypium davidsonii]|uniref:3'-5' exonuclease domain-containing protein n=2 Tax=Gossypium TaxID=3633 RepID=A0A7J8QV97_GOSDV|nr:hypothetical protein [Gossypium davidsonii]MBA0639953.1 hypothetical protein [Gossypium klotzschianum]
MGYYTHLVPFNAKIIETTVTDEASVAEFWVLQVRSKFVFHGQKLTIAGLNCKWKSHPIRSMSNKIATLQLCVDTMCLVIQLLHINHMPQFIKTFLSDTDVVFVGIDIEETVFKLQNEYGLSCGRIIDVRSLVKAWFPLSYYGKPGLKVLANRLVGLHKWRPSDDECLNNMDTRFLDEDQVKFACIDAYALCRIGHKLLKEDERASQAYVSG